MEIHCLHSTPLLHQPSTTPVWYACSSLCYQSEKDLEVTMQAARDAGVTVVSLPLVNQWTQVSPCSKIARLLSTLVSGVHILSTPCNLGPLRFVLLRQAEEAHVLQAAPCNLLLMSCDQRPSHAGSLTQPVHADVSSVSVCRTGTSRGSAPPNGGG